MGLKEFIKKEKYISIIDDLNIISVYDSYRYSYNDYNVLSRSQRNHLIKKLQVLDFKQLSGQILANHNHRIIFVKSSSLGVSPLVEIERIKPDGSILAVTPTTAALIISKELISIDPKKAMSLLSKLIDKCPINLEQFEIFSRGYDFHEKLVKNHIQEIRDIQNKTIKEKFEGRTIKLS